MNVQKNPKKQNAAQRKGENSFKRKRHLPARLAAFLSESFRFFCDFANLNVVQQYKFAKNFRNSYFNLNQHWENNFIKADSYYYYYPLFVLDVFKQAKKIINSKPDIKIKTTFS
jgi:hypothetical protein